MQKTLNFGHQRGILLESSYIQVTDKAAIYVANRLQTWPVCKRATGL